MTNLQNARTFKPTFKPDDRALIEAAQNIGRINNPKEFILGLMLLREEFPGLGLQDAKVLLIAHGSFGNSMKHYNI